MTKISLALRIAIALLLVLPFGVTAQDQTAHAFIGALYEPYKNAGFKGQPYWETERFFAPDLARAIERDREQARKRGEAPALNGDPFVDAQQWSVSVLAYATSTNADKTKAAGSVAFVSHDQPKGVVLSLVKTPQGWRITDILGPGGSLRTLYKLGP